MKRLFVNQLGYTRSFPSTVIVIVVALATSVSSPIGILGYEHQAVLGLVVPIAGTFAALALPAAQLAQAVQDKFKAGAEILIASEAGDLASVNRFLEKFSGDHRLVLGATRTAIYFGVIAFLVGLGGTFGVAESLSLPGVWKGGDFAASLSTAFLVAALLWFLPVVNLSFDLKQADRLVETLKKTQNTTAPRLPRKIVSARKSCRCSRHRLNCRCCRD